MKIPAAVGAALFLAGCGGKWLTGIDSDYPPDWPEFRQVAAGECPDVSGAWSNRSAASSVRDEQGGLLSWQLVRTAAKPAAVKITMRQDHLLVDLDGAGAALRRGEDFKCEDGALWLRPRTSSAAEVHGGYQSTRTLGFRRASDG